MFILSIKTITTTVSLRGLATTLPTKDGLVLDPMGDEFSCEPGFRREEIHRDFEQFIQVWEKRNWLSCDLYFGKIRHSDDI